MKKTMLTYRTLDKFEELVNPATLTEEQTKEVERLAYFANIGAESKAAAWDRFAGLAGDYLQIDLKTPTEEPEAEETPRTVEEVTADIIAYFEENEEDFNAAVEELDAYNGYLGDDRYYSMDDIDELYRDTEPSELLSRAYYGHDADTWTTDSSGNKEYGEFNPNRDYFRYNGYGNLVSADYKDYSDRLDKWAIEEMAENRSYINTIEDSEELAALFDALEQAREGGAQ